ncbi:TPA: hypothetical protein EYM26_13400 [Candidatus Poribacteria bacterium]|nr:hypothetical protein [Candidatus Poribacteria bacterium]
MQLNKQDHQLIRLFQLHEKREFKKRKIPYQIKPLGQHHIRFCRFPLTYSVIFFILLLWLSTGVLSQDTVSPATPSNTEISQTNADGTISKPESQPEKPPARLDPENASGEKDRIIGKGQHLIVNKNLVEIHGQALVKTEEIVLWADHIWADFDKDMVKAYGNVKLVVGDEETFSNELVYNMTTNEGIVHEGFTYSEPWYYRGKEIFKIGENESYIRGGSITSSPLKYPHYDFLASKIIVKTNKELIAKHVILRIGGFPLFYFPAYRRDLRKDKQAKVIFRLGTDSYQGPFMSIELPISRRRRLNGSIMFDQSSRRGRGGGTDGGYRVNDVGFDEIFLPFLPDATPSEKAKLKDLAAELADRLDGEFDHYKLRQLFFEYLITDEDVKRAHTKIQEVYTKLQAENADFGKISEANSDDDQTRYQGGDLGFLVRGEKDQEGELRLDPVLEEAAFALKAGEISQVLRTDRGFHILKVDHILDIYGEHEISIRRIDINISPSDETRETTREIAEKIQGRAAAGESLAQLASEFEESEVSDVNNGAMIPLNEMDSRWKYSVRRLEMLGEVTPTVMTDRGIHIFQLMEKEETPSFEEVARDFEETVGRSMIEEFEKRRVQKAEAEKKVPESKETGQDEEQNEEEKIKAYTKHGFKGRWEHERAVTREAQQLDRDESSHVIESKKGYHLINIKKKRTYRGDLFFYTNDQYSFSREEATRIGQRTALRWGHYHSIYTPWDNREEGRKPLNFMGRVELQSKSYKEGFGDSESAIDSFGMFTWGSAFSAIDELDTDDDGNLTFSTQRIGEFLGRLQVNHSLDLTGEGTRTLQKLPEANVSLSRMRVSNLPIFKIINDRMVKIAEKVNTDTPILSLLSFPTLENTSFDLDVNVGNFYRDLYQEEKNVYLLAGVVGFDVRKQSTLKISSTREAKLDLNLNTNFVWHDKDRDGNRHIFRRVYDVQVDVSTILFRIYDISFIPGARRMRHQMNSTVSASYAPPVDREDNLYPFGPSTYFYEAKDLTYRFDTSIEIKTQKNKTPLRILQFRTRLQADYTDYAAEWNRKYDFIDSNVTITPLASQSMNIIIRTTHDPNESELDQKRFKQVGFRSNVSYRRDKWDFSLGNSFSKRTSRASRRINFSFQFRPNSLIEIDLGADYDWIEKQFYSQRMTLRRNLNVWDLRISWHRVGIKRSPPYNNVRQDFTFQLNLLADPAVTVGLGYDATTETWGFRSLPVGVPYNAFGVGNGLSRSYF